MNNKQKLLTATASQELLSVHLHLLSSIMRSVEEKNSQMSVKKKNGNHILITF